MRLLRRLVNWCRRRWCHWRHRRGWELWRETTIDGRRAEFSIGCPRCKWFWHEATFNAITLEQNPWAIIEWVEEAWPQFVGAPLHSSLRHEAARIANRAGPRISGTERALVERLGHCVQPDVLHELATAADAAGITVRGLSRR